MIALPMAYTLSVQFEVGVTGLWTGMAIGQILIPTIYAYLFINIDWMDVFELNRRQRAAVQEKERLRLGRQSQVSKDEFPAT